MLGLPISVPSVPEVAERLSGGRPGGNRAGLHMTRLHGRNDGMCRVVIVDPSWIPSHDLQAHDQLTWRGPCVCRVVIVDPSWNPS